MNWKFWKRAEAPTTQEEGESSEPEVFGIGDVLHDVGHEIAPVDSDRWDPDELGVESLYLPFGVSKGWADDPDLHPPYTLPAKLPNLLTVPSGYPDRFREIVFPVGQPIKIHSEPEPSERFKATPPTCYALLYQRMDRTRIDGTEILQPSRCMREKFHEGKHGIEGVEYLHPDEYPNRVGTPPITDAGVALRKIMSLLQEAVQLFDDFKDPKPL